MMPYIAPTVRMRRRIRKARDREGTKGEDVCLEKG
jgi:hypothetical protein